MSYDLSLVHPLTKQPINIEFKHNMAGGTYVSGGSTALSLNITYNYAYYYYKYLDKKDGIRVLYGKTGLECIPLLEDAISKLKDDVSEDYWEPTEGNAKAALIQLLTMSKMRPDCIWLGD